MIVVADHLRVEELEERYLPCMGAKGSNETRSGSDA